MKYDVFIDPSCKEPRVEIHTKEITTEVNDIIQKLSQIVQRNILGYDNDLLTILNPADIIRIYSQDKKVFAVTISTTYQMKSRLYELEELLSTKQFIRISNTEIINFDYVQNLDLSLIGTICIHFKNRDRTYVSRRYVAKIKEYLGI